MSSSSIPIVLLHGLNRSARSMRSVQRALQRDDRSVINIDYPSGRYGIAELTRRVHEALLDQCVPGLSSGIDFVTHSLGGIVVRALRVQFPKVAIRRVAMLGPPNQGSEVVDALRAWRVFNRITGPAGPELGTARTSVPNSLGPVDFELGVVAGNASVNPLFSWLVPGPNDGPVAVRRTQVEGMTDFIIVRASHTFIMHNTSAIRQAREFLRHGRFDHARQHDSME